MATTCNLTSTDGKLCADASLYRCIVGSLQYLAFTHPNLAFVVHKVNKFMHNPLESH